MQEVEAKRKMTPADGAHIFYTMIFLAGSYMALNTAPVAQCSVNLTLFAQILFYGEMIWMTYLVITLVPRYKNQGLRLFFNLLDLFYGLYHLALFTYAGYIFYSPQNDCAAGAPALNFLANLYIAVMSFTFFIATLTFGSYLFRRIFKRSENSGFVRSDEL